MPQGFSEEKACSGRANYYYYQDNVGPGHLQEKGVAAAGRRRLAVWDTPQRSGALPPQLLADTPAVEIR